MNLSNEDGNKNRQQVVLHSIEWFDNALIKD